MFKIDSLDLCQPRASSFISYDVTDHDKDAIEELRSWASQKESLNNKFVNTNLKDLSVSQTFINLLCQVVSKCYTMSGNGIVLTLWDGSLPACQSTQVEPISEQGKLTCDELLKKSANRCVEVFLYDNHMEGDVKNVCPGDFVCIRNVHLKEVKNSASVTADDSKVPIYIEQHYKSPVSKLKLELYHTYMACLLCFSLQFCHVLSDKCVVYLGNFNAFVLCLIFYQTNSSFHFDHGIELLWLVAVSHHQK